MTRIASRFDREIAEVPFVSPRTAGAHVSHLLGALGGNRAAAVLATQARGWTSLSPG